MAELGLNMHIVPTAMPIAVRLSELFLKHSDIKYIPIIMPARTLDGVNPATNTKPITKSIVAM